MLNNTGGFNAPSREAIWYRIHKLVFGDSWEYDYEEFVSYDALNRKTSRSSATAGEDHAAEQSLAPTHPPVLMGMTWQEALAKAAARPARPYSASAASPAAEAR